MQIPRFVFHSTVLLLTAVSVIAAPLLDPQEQIGGTVAQTQPDELKGDLYTLDTCPVSGQKLGSMGEPVIKEIEGREVRFCCAGCVKPFTENSAKHFTEIDKELTEQQLPHYPISTCVVTDEPLTDNGEDIGIDHIYKNRLVRFCCKGCIRDFHDDPQKYLDKLDELVIEKQRRHYPLDTCIVSDQKLGSMGEPVELISGNRLVRFCCKGCIQSFEETPAPYIARLDEAWREIQRRNHGSHSREDNGMNGPKINGQKRDESGLHDHR